MPEEEHTCSPWARTCNAISLAGWVFLQFHIGWQLLLDSAAFVQSDITFDVYILKPLQLFQLLDIVLILMGQSKGSLLGSIFQITGRLIVALIFVETATNPVRFALMVLCWSIAEVTRYLYYLFKSIPLIGLLRYHVFLVMYPLGAYAEMTLINDYIKRHAETLEDWQIQVIRVVQVSIILGIMSLYCYMWKMRRIFMAKQKEVQDQNKALAAPRSPRAKRD